MPAVKFLDKRYTTHGGGYIRIEVWLDPTTRAVVRYNLAYLNPRITSRDSGRVVGFDNSHTYPGFRTPHHCHWYGRVIENDRFRSYDQTELRFQRLLLRLKRRYGTRY
jgi:hypothetical protein